MISEKKISKVIFDAIDEVNEQLAGKKKLDKSMDLVLYPSKEGLDSLEFINLIVTIEQKVEDEFKIALSLVDEEFMSEENNPFKTLRTLATYISVRLDEKQV
jgi:acyl carrier protein